MLTLMKVNNGASTHHHIACFPLLDQSQYVAGCIVASLHDVVLSSGVI